MWGCGVHTDCWGWSRLLKDLMGQILERNLSNEGDRGGEMPEATEIKAPLLVDDECGNDFIDVELSPRLTNLIKSGIVPESPINDRGLLNGKKTNEFLVTDFVSPAQLKYSSVSPINNVIQTPVSKLNNDVHIRGCTSTAPGIEEAQTPFANLTNTSCSKDWLLSSGEKSESIEQRRKLKRLRKVGDCGKSRNLKSIKENSVPIANLARLFSSPFRNKCVRGKKNPVIGGRAFIEEEAEVSSDADISDDEEDEQDNNSNDSFIDDGINPTAASTQAESCRVDMMAIYRRSLLSQSPMHRQPNCSATLTPDSLASMARISESGSGISSGKTLYSLQTPQTESANGLAGRYSDSSQMCRISSQVVPCTTNVSSIGKQEIESRKRKLSFHLSESVPKINLEPEFMLQSDATGRDSFQHHNQNGDANEDAFYDDQFYEGLDLDAMEAQATLLFKQKSDLSIKKQEIIPQLHAQNPSLISSPSFDLGI